MSAERRSKTRSKPGRPGPPRVPPDEATGREESYLRRRKEARSPMVVHLADGTTLRGVIEYFDRDVIKLARPGEPGLLIRKADIRYAMEESRRTT